MSNVLILVETAQGKVKKASLAGISFGQQVAQKTGGSLFLLLLGHNIQTVAQQVKNFGAAKIYTADDANLAHYLVESYASVVLQATQASNATYVASSASSTSKDLLPRVAARLEAGMASDVLSVVDATTFTRPMWAGNVIATVQITSAKKVCTIRSTEFTDPTPSGEVSAIEALPVQIDLSSLKAKFISHKEIKSERPDVTTAERVVSGGRGVKSAEGFKVIEQLADTLHAGIGASRAVCDAGWVPNDLQIGQTGKIVAPNLYIAVGISGAIQHLAGMKDSKVIAAINKDPEAPIFQVADYGLVGDLFQAVPELIKALKS